MPWEAPHCPRIHRGELYGHELMLIVYFARKVNAKKIFEIGTFRGRTALVFAQNTDALIYTLDVDRVPDDASVEDMEYILPEEKIGALYREAGCSNVVQLWGDSRVFDFTPYYGQMDIVLVDGSKAHMIMLNDLKEALRMVSQNGIVFVHDYQPCFPEYMQALKDFAADRDDVVNFHDTLLVAFGEPLRGEL